MRGLYQRNGIYWARFKVRGHEYRESLRTRSEARAERRLKARKQQRQDRPISAPDPVSAGRPRSFHGPAHGTSSASSAERPARYLTSLGQGPPLAGRQEVHDHRHSALKEIVRCAQQAGASNATIRRDMTAISSVLGHCVDENWIEENPAHMMDRSRFKERKAKDHPAPSGGASCARPVADSRFMDMAAPVARDWHAARGIAGLEHDRVDRRACRQRWRTPRTARSGRCRCQPRRLRSSTGSRRFSAPFRLLAGRRRALPERRCRILRKDGEAGGTQSGTGRRAVQALPVPRSAPPFRGDFPARAAWEHLRSAERLGHESSKRPNATWTT
jgi:hypothetical protein